MNDLWALPSGEWVVYSDEEDVIKDLKTLADLEIITLYHGMLSRHRAVQFRFPDNDVLLRYVCFVSGFNYSRAVRLQKRPGVGYRNLFGRDAHQPPLFVEVSPPRRKGKGRTR
ncbi:MAG: hypothetical protein ACOY4I_15825 [Bacillota bacterium]